MTKEEFLKLGLTEEQAVSCAKASEAELKGFVPKAKLDMAEQAKETLELQAKEYDKQIQLLKKSAGDSEQLNQTIAKLQAANKQAKADYDQQVKTLKIGYAVDAALGEAKAKNLTAVKALLDLQDADMDDKGKVKGLEEQIKKLKEAKETAFLFDIELSPKDGKPKVPTGKDGDDGNLNTEGSGVSKTGIGASFAKAYNAMFGSKASGKGEE